MKLILFALVLIAGCAAQPANDPRGAQFKQFGEQINAQREKKEIGYADGQQKKWDYSKSLWPNDPYSAEFFAYTIMLGEKVDRGEMPVSEYMYLATQKDNQLRDRLSAEQSRQTRDAAAIMQSMPVYQPVIQPLPTYQMRRPTQTNCHTDQFGNTNCTTY